MKSPNPAAIAILAAGLVIPLGAWGRGAAADQGISHVTLEQEKRAEEKRANRAPAGMKALTPESMRSLVPSDPAWYSSPQPWHLVEPDRYSLGKANGDGPLRGTSGSNVPAWRRNIYFRDFHWLPP